MRLKLVESAQPIEKLENNIVKNILPGFRDIDVDLSSKPTKLNMWGDVYLGTYFPNRKVAKLYLYTSSDEIDIWNEENSDIFVADLFAILKIGMKEIEIGCLSSRDPKSVQYALDNPDIDKAFKELPPKEKEEDKETIPNEDNKLIPPGKENSGYEPMTKEDWQKERDRLNAELNEYYKQKDMPMTDEEREELYRHWKKKIDYFNGTFLHHIYPSELRGW